MRLPLGSWDTHCHVLGPTDRFPYASTAPVDFIDAPKEKLFALHAMLGVERCVIVHTAAHGFDLRVTEDALAAKGGTYLGVALLPTTVDDTELRRLDRRGFCGARYNFMPHLHRDYSFEQVVEFLPRLADIGWHLQIHMEGTVLPDMESTLARSSVPVVIDHIARVDAGLGLGQPQFKSLASAVPGRLTLTQSRSRAISSLSFRIVSCGAPIGRTPITRGRSRMMASWSTSSPKWRRPMRRKLMVDNPRRLYDMRGRNLELRPIRRNSHQEHAYGSAP